MSDVINQSVQQWRQQARNGELTVEQMKLAIAAIRAERLKAGDVSSASKAKVAGPAKPRTLKAKVEAVDSDKLLDDLMNGM